LYIFKFIIGGYLYLICQLINILSLISKTKTTLMFKQSVVSQKQSVVSQKQSVVYTSWKIYKLKLKSLREREIEQTVYTGSLLNQELHPVSQNTLGNPLSNQT